MKVVRIHERGGTEVMRVEEVDTPHPRAGQVVVRVRAAGVNFADLMQRDGTYPVLWPLPAVLGVEVAGEIVEVGRGVAWGAGARVAAAVRGGYAEYALAREDQLISLQEGVDFPRGATAPVQGTTAAMILEEVSPVRRTDAVLIHAAAGGVGALAVQLARRAGARVVIGASRSAAKAGRILALGADHAVDCSAPDWATRVNELTGGKGADLILEMAGGAIGTKSFDCLAEGGRMVMYGMASRAPAQIDPGRVMFKNQSVHGFVLSSFIGPRQVAAATRVLEAALAGKVKLDIAAVLPLAEAARAHQMLASGEALGKVVLVP
jgi:NADPH2:quinone reductase